VEVAVGGSGNVFVADGGNSRVVKFDPFGRQLAVFTGFAMPAAVAVDRGGNIYVADETALQVTKLAPSGRSWPDGTFPGSPAAGPGCRSRLPWMGREMSTSAPTASRRSVLHPTVSSGPYSS
jgi:hypothetical protein